MQRIPEITPIKTDISITKTPTDSKLEKSSDDPALSIMFTIKVMKNIIIEKPNIISIDSSKCFKFKGISQTQNEPTFYKNKKRASLLHV